MFFAPEQIERGIFEAIRCQSIIFGHWVDETSIEQATELRNALQALQNPIEPIGIGDYLARGERPTNCLVLDFDTGESGEVGAIGRVSYVAKGTQKFDKIGYPSQSENLTFKVVILAQDTFHRRLAERILRAALPQKKFLQGIKEDGSYTENGFWLFRNNFRDLSKGGIYGIERVWSYTVANVFLEEITSQEIAAMIDTDIDLNPQ